MSWKIFSLLEPSRRFLSYAFLSDMSSNSVTTRGSFSASITAAMSITKLIWMLDLCHDVNFLADDFQKIRLSNHVMETFHCYLLPSKCALYHNPPGSGAKNHLHVERDFFSWDLPELTLVGLFGLYSCGAFLWTCCLSVAICCLNPSFSLRKLCMNLSFSTICCLNLSFSADSCDTCIQKCVHYMHKIAPHNMKNGLISSCHV